MDRIAGPGCGFRRSGHHRDRYISITHVDGWSVVEQVSEANCVAVIHAQPVQLPSNWRQPGLQWAFGATSSSRRIIIENDLTNSHRCRRSSRRITPELIILKANVDELPGSGSPSGSTVTLGKRIRERAQNQGSSIYRATIQLCAEAMSAALPILLGLLIVQITFLVVYVLAILAFPL